MEGYLGVDIQRDGDKITLLQEQAERGCARSRLLLKICVVAKRMVRTTINLVGTLHVVQYVHHKRGGMLRTGYRLKEQEMTM